MQILCLLCLYNHIRIPADIFLSFSVKGSFIYDVPRGRDGSLKIYSYKIYKHFNKKTKNSFNLISDNFRTKISSTWLKHRQILFLPKLQIITDLIFAELDWNKWVLLYPQGFIDTPADKKITNPIKPLRMLISQFSTTFYSTKEIRDTKEDFSIVMIDDEAETTSTTGNTIILKPGLYNHALQVEFILIMFFIKAQKVSFPVIKESE